jgi:hypothetical protein
VKPAGIALTLVLALMAAAQAASDAFQTDKPSPLKLARKTGRDSPVTSFVGTVQISGSYRAAWEGPRESSRSLRVTFAPNEESAARLPHAVGADPVQELFLINGAQAAGLLVEGESARKLLTKEQLAAAGEATITITGYQAVIECDQRHYLARLVSVARRQPTVVAERPRRDTGC